MEEELKLIREELKNLNRRIDKMDKHIDFVHGIYSYVKYPLGFFCDKINRWSGNNKEYSLEDGKN